MGIRRPRRSPVPFRFLFYLVCFLLSFFFKYLNVFSSLYMTSYTNYPIIYKLHVPRLLVDREATTTIPAQ